MPTLQMNFELGAKWLARRKMRNGRLVLSVLAGNNGFILVLFEMHWTFPITTR